MNTSQIVPEVGIDDISVYIPSLYLKISELAEARGIEPAKLEKGLGLIDMSVPDASEDVITMGAEALIDLVKKNDLKPEEISRIYVGTESMVDGSKPIASYLLGILMQYYDQRGIPSDVLGRCDVIDMTFACIGATDAMHNSLDYIRLNPDKKAIVIATDWAKYDLASPGEYTQGAGAIALLLSAEPRVASISRSIGVSTQCEHDFYKPLRRMIREDDNAGVHTASDLKFGRELYAEHKETPVYDGQFSNQCYTDRITEALTHLRSMQKDTDHPFDRWSRMIFHLPYAFHARRVFSSLYIEYLQEKGEWEGFLKTHGLGDGEQDPALLRAVSKTDGYRQFVTEKIAPGERASSHVGNLYTGSVFLSLVSCLESEPDFDFSNNTFGFYAYGSGSKAKVFEGKINPGYKECVDRLGLNENLTNRINISFQQYEFLHKAKLLHNLDSRERRVFQHSCGWTETNRFARNYAVHLKA